MFTFKKLSRLLATLVLALAIANLSGNAFARAMQVQSASQIARTPIETVREFYKALREKRFREAFAMSVYNSAINGLTDAEFAMLQPEFKKLSDKEFAALRPKFQTLTEEEYNELRPDFENLAATIPTDVTISGEQISVEAATVFVSVKDADGKSAQAAPVALFRQGGAWIIGDRASAGLVRQEGKDFFFNLRIKTHEDEARQMLRRINMGEIVYAAQHNGVFAGIAALVAAGLVPKDVETSASTGYSFQLMLAPDAHTYTVSATPARYNRTGRLSFFMDASGVKALDTGGKIFDPRSVKKP